MNRPKLLGILNITPDSFADGGRDNLLRTSLLHAEQLLEDGADILDIGAESTRPGAIPLSHEEEWGRLEPMLTILRKWQIPLSLDTYHLETMRRAIDYGVSFINDVSGFKCEEKLRLLLPTDIRLISMHSLDVPTQPNHCLPETPSAFEQLRHWTQQEIKRLTVFGFTANRLVLDPGIGFGKNPEQSLELLIHIDQLLTPPYSLLVGHSRKSFFQSITGTSNPNERDPETITTSVYLAIKGVQYLRVHDIRANLKALKTAEILFL